MSLIEKILSRYGYIHRDKLTEDFLCFELAKTIGDPTEYSIEPKQEEYFFRDFARIDGARDYLRATMAKDMQRDFGATPDQRQLIRGAFARTSYFLSKIRGLRSE